MNDGRVTALLLVLTLGACQASGCDDAATADAGATQDHNAIVDARQDDAPSATDSAADDRRDSDTARADNRAFDSTRADSTTFDRHGDDVNAPDAMATDAVGQDQVNTDAAISVDSSNNPGFVADPGFSVNGNMSHGSLLRITSSTGGFGERRFTAPWVWDVVAQQYVAGVDQAAYNDLNSGDEIPTTVWAKTMQAGVGRHCRYYSDRPLRHSRLNASYGTVADSDDDTNHKGVVGYPHWPYGGSQDNTQLYVTWWQRVRYPYFEPGRGATSEDKIFRLSDSAGTGQGANFWSLGGLAATTVDHGDKKAWRSLPSTSEWVRFEIFADKSLGAFDAYLNGALWIGSYSGVPGDFEFRPAEHYLHVDPPHTGYDFAGADWLNLSANMIGYDDAGTTVDSRGQAIDFGEIYVDTSQARVEISELAQWEVHTPGQYHRREVQGQLVSWTESAIELHINQGGFDSLAGTHLYVILHDGSALRIGRFE